MDGVSCVFFQTLVHWGFEIVGHIMNVRRNTAVELDHYAHFIDMGGSYFCTISKYITLCTL